MTKYYLVSFSTTQPALAENMFLRDLFQALNMEPSVVETRFVEIQEDNYETAQRVINFIKSLPGFVEFGSYALFEGEVKDTRKLILSM